MINSTSEFENSILAIESLNIGYPLEKGNQRALRDTFINTLKHPLSNLWRRPVIHTVLKNFNLKLQKGDRLGLLGVNGTGKTSLCRFVAGMHGRKNNIKVNGELRAIFNTETGVIPELSGRENAEILATLMYPLISKKELTSLIEESIEFSELGHFADEPFSIYSKGMKTRLYLSLVSARPCDLLILDEVFDGADVFFNEKISLRIHNIIKKSGAVLFVAHSTGQIREVCNRIVVLHKQGKAFDGNVEDGVNFYLNQCNPNGRLN